MNGRKKKPSGTHRAQRSAGAPPRAEATRPAILSALTRLLRTVSVEMGEREIVERFVDCLTEVLPGPVFSVTLAPASSRRLALFQTSVDYAPAGGGELEVPRAALRRQGLDEDNVPHEGVIHFAEERPDEFSVVLVDGDRIGGVLTATYPAGSTPPESHQLTLLEFGLHLEGLLRGARVLGESDALREHFFELIDHANAPILVIGRHRRVKVANRAALALMGATSDSVVGEDFLSLLPESERPRMVQVIVGAMRGEPISNFEVRLERRGGGLARMTINTASLMGPDGEADAVIAIGRDLTEVRELEERVIQAEKLATLGQLAAGVVHELNNPLTSISVYSDHLVKKLGAEAHDERDIEKLRRIHQNTDRILRFTRDLVTYARPSTGVPADESIHAILDQSLMFCEHVISDAGAAVVRKYGAEVSNVYAIKAQLHQVFINLVTNACHAVPEGAGKLIVETRNTEDGVVVRVTDNGPGVPLEQRDRIFEPFYSTKGEGKGTGLGLSIARNIVLQHGGTLRLESEVGLGATFEVTLPRRH